MRRVIPFIAILALAGCGSSTKPADIPAGGPSTETVPLDTTSTPTQTTPAALVDPKPGKGVPKVSTSKDLTKKPVIPKQTGTPPTKLVIQDVVKGKGKAAKA